MTKEELIQKMLEVQQKHASDNEVIHIKWDELLLEYINDEEVTKIFNSESLWYAQELVIKILISCEMSGRVRDAFIRKGHEAVSCDILPSLSDFGPHIQGDVLQQLDKGWDMMIAFPPCK